MTSLCVDRSLRAVPGIVPGASLLPPSQTRQPVGPPSPVLFEQSGEEDLSLEAGPGDEIPLTQPAPARTTSQASSNSRHSSSSASATSSSSKRPGGAPPTAAGGVGDGIDTNAQGAREPQGSMGREEKKKKKKDKKKKKKKKNRKQSSSDSDASYQPSSSGSSSDSSDSAARKKKRKKRLKNGVYFGID
jgi:hypothetical protein